MQLFLDINGIIDLLTLCIIQRFENNLTNDRKRKQNQFSVLVAVPDNFTTFDISTFLNNNISKLLWTYANPRKMTAASKTNIHAEHQLLNSNTFDNCKRMKFKFILLYTWIAPCKDCASLIVEEIHRFFPGTPAFVRYTTNAFESDSHVEEVTKMLNDEGIRTGKVKYLKNRVGRRDTLP